jgi:hypothetical protein
MRARTGVGSNPVEDALTGSTTRTMVARPAGLSRATKAAARRAWAEPSRPITTVRNPRREAMDRRGGAGYRESEPRMRRLFGAFAAICRAAAIAIALCRPVFLFLP